MAAVFVPGSWGGAQSGTWGCLEVSSSSNMSWFYRKRLEKKAKKPGCSDSSVATFQRQALDGYGVIRSQILRTLEIARGQWWRPEWAAGGAER